MVLQIVPREEWAEEPPKEIYRVDSPVANVFSSYTYTQMCTTSDKCKWIVQLLHRRHLMSNKSDIKYSFLIGGDAKVYEGRGWTVQPNLPFGYYELNRNSIYVGLIGTFKHFDVPNYMKVCLQELVDYGLKNNYIIPNYYFEKMLNNNNMVN